MAKSKFVLNRKGIKNIYQSQEVLNLTKQYAERLYPDDEKKSFVGFDRCKTVIYRKSEDPSSDKS